MSAAEGLVDSDDDDDKPLVRRPRQPAPPREGAAPENEEPAATSETRSFTLQEQVQRLQDRVDDLRAELQVERLASEQKDGIISKLEADLAKLVRLPPPFRCNVH